MIEETILKTIHGFSNPVFDLAAVIISYGLLFFVFAILILFFHKRKQFFSFLSGFLLTLGITQIIKWIVHRPRPYFVIEGIKKVTSLSASFPSMHASLAFFIAVFLSRYHKKYIPFLFMFAILVSLSRVYLMLHYFSDIIAGAVLGSIIAYLFIKKEKVILTWLKKSGLS